MGWIGRATCALLVLAIMAGPAYAAERLALLIGNESYDAKVGPLKNPHNDIALVGAALRTLKFSVTEIKDADYGTIDKAINRHIQNVRRAGSESISLIYYAGHGAANPDTKINYLIPIDVTNADDDELWANSINLNRVVEGLREQAPNATHYIVFDACRNELNLTAKGKRSLAERGLVPMSYTPGVMIAYSTAPGKTATDVGDGAGIYARALAEEIVKPGLEAVTMFRRVALRVNREIGQDPWMAASTVSEVYLAGEVAIPGMLVAPGDLKEQQLAIARQAHADVLALTADDTAIQKAAALLTEVERATRNGDDAATSRLAAELRSLGDELTREYTFTIVSRPGEVTGVWRQPPGSSDRRNYYLVVEAIAPDGRKLSLPIRNEENGLTETVGIFGVRVSREVYEGVAQDRMDDGIVQRNQFGIKRRGTLAIQYLMPFEGGFITKW
jgi:uncharacterized protein DUF6384/caspase domain-containing protein